MHPFGVLAAGLLVSTLLTAGAGIWHHTYELSHQKPSGSNEKISQKSKEQSAQTPTAPSSEDVLGETSSTNNKAESKSSAPKSSTKQTNQKGSTPTASTSQSSQNPGTVSASLSINGTSKGSVLVPANSNHCDILTQALKNGQIGSLDLRYSSQYGTYAVYMIDGVGDSNAVWWTYKVNGSSPPYGCSQMPAKDGDSVHWQYVKR